MSRIQPVSFALGLALGVYIPLAMSQASVVNTPLWVEYMPHPRDMVQIKEGVPNTVPVGKVFVLTGLGAALPAPTADSILRVDGVIEITAPADIRNVTATVLPVAHGFSVPGQSTITVESPGSSAGARAWGYLAQQ